MVKCNFSGVALGDSWISPLGMGHSLILSMFLQLESECLLDFGTF